MSCCFLTLRILLVHKTKPATKTGLDEESVLQGLLPQVDKGSKQGAFTKIRRLFAIYIKSFLQKGKLQQSGRGGPKSHWETKPFLLDTFQGVQKELCQRCKDYSWAHERKMNHLLHVGFFTFTEPEGPLLVGRPGDRSPLKSSKKLLVRQ